MISVIIPTYNEEENITSLLQSFNYNDNCEVIIVDGGSSDKTVELAAKFPVKILKSGNGRAKQMNVGANHARGDILLFLHADCILEDGSIGKIKDSIKDGFIAGCLRHKIVSSRMIYRFIEFSGDLRARLYKVFYGDQAIFVKKDCFFKLGGYDDVELFDDVMFSKKLRKAGRICILDKNVYTQPRRWENQGVLRTTFINWTLTLGFMFGVPVRRLKSIYTDIR